MSTNVYLTKTTELMAAAIKYARITRTPHNGDTDIIHVKGQAVAEDQLMRAAIEYEKALINYNEIDT